jgi:polyhydroxybutyrate depolymerase
VGEQTFTIKSANGVTYTYSIVVSEKVDRNSKSPVMVHWHALGSSPEEMRMVTHVDTLTQTTNAIMIYPKSPDQSWDVGSCCTNTKLLATRRDELVFAKELIADIKTKVCVDEKRIYTAGFSNGGMMSQMLACKAADIFAAAFPMGSTLTIPQDQCKPSRPIPIMLINGTKDPLVGYDSAGLAGGLSVPADYKLWQTKNGCTGEPETTFQKGKTTCTTYKNCKAGAETAACVVEGMGHCVPGMKLESAQNCLTKDGIALGPGSDDMDGITVMSDFLVRFSMP